MFSSPNDKCGQPGSPIRAFPSVRVPGGPGLGDSWGKVHVGPHLSPAELCLSAEERSPCAGAELCSAVVLAGGAGH